MVTIVTIHNDPKLYNAQRELKNLAASNGWLFTVYGNEDTHLMALRDLTKNLRDDIGIIDCVCHATPDRFDSSTNGSAKRFGASLSELNGFKPTSTTIYLDGCNTARSYVGSSEAPIAQMVANGAGCTVYGSKGYIKGTKVQKNERCWTVDPDGRPVEPDPNFRGDDVWQPFGRQKSKVAPGSDVQTYSFQVDASGQVWMTVDPPFFGNLPKTRRLDFTVRAGDTEKTDRELEITLNDILRGDNVYFPDFRMAPDVSINYIARQRIHILDIYARFHLLRDRVTGETKRIKDPLKMQHFAFQKIL
jgi:hypothetical protein